MIECALKKGVQYWTKTLGRFRQTLALGVAAISLSHCGRILSHLIVLMYKSSYTWKEPKREVSPLVILAMKGNGKVSMLPIFSTLDELYINGSGVRDCVMNLIQLKTYRELAFSKC